ncbi:biotin/lipoyl-containing protein [Pseudomonas syringae]|uniref:Acetyl-CoA carboxylase, biotin carboxyl carrier protein n=1 Tax=Pseudomonas syringae pv. actinidiae TaxID=103796 RepID=A0A7Z6U7U8_PSESF|nr:biotin/lipoyl-containing protein [Pseudomonas syringae]RMP80916.1 Acetyl-CoA carboxylase, biotin carboxyl carrier protein [Pseudomonas syringae pv. actinidiae]
MNINEIRQLAGWIRDAGLTVLELKRPGFELLIRRGIRADSHASRADLDVAVEQPPATALVIAADNPGVFVSRHSDEKNSYVKPGDTVAAGQLLGLLRIGLLYLPVRSQQAGRVTRFLAAEHERVGYGQPLIELEE